MQKKSPQNLRKRSIAKGWLTEEEARHKIPDTKQSQLDLPYLQLQSLSNKNVLRIYVKHSDITQQAYSSYGFSSQATIPWF